MSTDYLLGKYLSTTESITRLDQGKHEKMFLNALNYAPDFLKTATETPLIKFPLSIAVSPSRGNQPVISREPIDVEHSRVAVVANAKALDYNSPAFVNPSLDPKTAAAIVDYPGGYSHRVLAYSKPGDLFIFETSDKVKSLQILNMIADFYESLGKKVTRDFHPVASTQEWVRDQNGAIPILFGSAIDPLCVTSFAQSAVDADAIMARFQSNIAAYTKPGAERLWASEEVPVPFPTLYVAGGSAGEDATRIALQQLQKYGDGEIVISTPSGSSGDGVQFVPLRDALEIITQEYDEHHCLQLQQKLPLAGCPCTIANILPDGSFEILMTSEQRFTRPGSHGGNMWVRPGVDRPTLPEKFDESVSTAIDTLARAGVVGQVNIDSLVISERTMREFSQSSQVLSREANIRPAGSSVILAMKEGTLESQRIDRINTVSISIAFEILTDPQFQKYLASLQQKGLRVGIFHYDLVHGKVGLAFLGAEGTSAQQFNQFEHDVTKAIQQFRVQ